MYDSEVESRPVAEQLRIDEIRYRRQIEYLFSHSPFYVGKLRAAGFHGPGDVGDLDRIQHLPFTHKEELRQSQAQHPPFGAHLACAPGDLVRVYSTSGTSGTPCFIGLTRNDLDMFATNVARGYTAGGFAPGQRVVVSANAGPFAAGAVYNGLDRIGCTTLPVGTGNTRMLIDAIRKLGATGISCTPSHALYLMDWCADHGIDTRELGLRNMITAGEPGGGDPLTRGRIENAFGCTVREAMGIADISLTVWAEDADARGMHLMARGFAHVELIDPDTAQALPWEDGVQGELVYTALQREAMPLLRFRSRDHVRVCMQPNPCGRTGPRIRCIGRTDDLLIVRGVNLFPSAVRDVLNDFAADTGSVFQVRPRAPGVAQTPPLPITVELARGHDTAPAGLRERLEKRIRERLLVTAAITLVPYGSLPRGEYKTRHVDFSFVSE